MNGHFHARLIYLLFTHIKYAKLLSVRKTSAKIRVATAAPTRPPPVTTTAQVTQCGLDGNFFRTIISFLPASWWRTFRTFDIDTSGVRRRLYNNNVDQSYRQTLIVVPAYTHNNTTMVVLLQIYWQPNAGTYDSEKGKGNHEYRYFSIHKRPVTGYPRFTGSLINLIMQHML